MLQQQGPNEAPITLSAGGLTRATTTAPSEPRIGLMGPWSDRVRGARLLPRWRLGAISGRFALGAMLLATTFVVLVATSGPSILVPRSTAVYPGWDVGPLSGLLPQITHDAETMGLYYSAIVVAMLMAYLIALTAVRTLSLRLIVGVVVALHVILLLSPPLQLNDVFNYLGYARLGGLHGLNPYTHVINGEQFDPVFRFSTWHNLRSPYGSLFTALTYPLAFLPLPVAYWILKVVTVAMSLGFLALVAECARRLGRDPRFALALVALNPIYLLYAVGGFHNDFFMLVPMMAAIALLLAGRDRSAGAMIVLAVAVKFTAVLLLPFLLVAAVTRPRRERMLAGAVFAAVPMIVLSLALFGLSLPNLSDQSTLLTPFSFPNVFGLILGVGGGTSDLLRLASVAVVVVVGYLLYARREWLVSAGWCTFALIASLAWLMPWYVIWLLPIAAVANSTALRRTAIVLTAYLIFAFMPTTGQVLQDHGLSLLNTPAGQASSSYQHKLAVGP